MAEVAFFCDFLVRCGFLRPGEDEGGDDGEVVAKNGGDDVRLHDAPRGGGCSNRARWGRTGEDVIDFFAWLAGAEGGLVGRGAVGPLGEEPLYGRVVRRGVEVASEDGRVRHVIKVLQDVLDLRHTAQAVECLKMRASHHNGVSIGEHKGALEQSTLLHFQVRVGQLDVVHIHKLVAREQPYAIVTTAELDGGAEQSLHAAVVGEFGNKVVAVLMPAVGAMRVLIHFLQRHEVGVVLLDEEAYLLQAGVVARMQVERHHCDGVGVA